MVEKKLVELLIEIEKEYEDIVNKTSVMPNKSKFIAERLVANGVTAQEKGEWIETEEGTICSECHEHPFEDGYYAIANYNGDFCPNCGAKMEQEG